MPQKTAPGGRLQAAGGEENGFLEEPPFSADALEIKADQSPLEIGAARLKTELTRLTVAARACGLDAPAAREQLDAMGLTLAQAERAVHVADWRFLRDRRLRALAERRAGF